MGFSGKTVEINLDQVISKIKNYFSNVTRFEQFAWIAIMTGVILIIISLIIW
jgi:flagellar biosynthesis/type III secretory pathway M-ring protein FliF/YscJ